MSSPILSGQSDKSALLEAIDASKRQGSVDDAPQPFTSYQASGNRKGIHVKVFAKVLLPPPRRDAAKQDGVGVSAISPQDPSHADRHPIGKIVPVLFSRADEIEVLDNGLQSGDNPHHNGEDGARKRNGNLGRRDGLRNGLPRHDRGCLEGTSHHLFLWQVSTPYARVRGHEEDKDSRRQEDRDQRAYGLGVELVLGGRLEQKANPKVGHQAVGNVCTARRDVAGYQVDSLGISNTVIALCDAAVHQLRGLG